MEKGELLAGQGIRKGIPGGVVRAGGWGWRAQVARRWRYLQAVDRVAGRGCSGLEPRSQDAFRDLIDTK